MCLVLIYEITTLCGTATVYSFAKHVQNGVFIVDIFKGTTLTEFQRLNKINRNQHLATMYISKPVIHHNVSLGKRVT